MSQEKQRDWFLQWEQFTDDTAFLFEDWIYPTLIRDFKGKTVLDAGCGGGYHLELVAPFARKVVGVDLNTAELARERTASFGNVTIVEADIAQMDLGEQFDMVYSVGVVHHTDDPDQTVANLWRHVKPGGRLILWVYAHEGNFLNRALIEPLKKILLRRLPKPLLKGLAFVLTAALYLPVYTLYHLPLRFLWFYEYFENWRKLSFRRNLLNVFDKLNAPQTFFIRRDQAAAWLDPQEFQNIHLSRYRGVSWRVSGERR